MIKLHTNTVMAAIACMLLSSAGAMAASQISEQGETESSYKGQELAKDAVVSMEDAKVAALKYRPGTITDSELEKEDGGLRYSFDIKSGDKEYEVGIDAKTGKLLENDEEGSHPD